MVSSIVWTRLSILKKWPGDTRRKKVIQDYKLVVINHAIHNLRNSDVKMWQPKYLCINYNLAIIYELNYNKLKL